MHVVGLVLHPERDCGGAVGSVLDWADRRSIRVLGVVDELSRLACTAEPVTAEEMRERADLLVSLGGDGTMLRAMRLADSQRFPVLGVNLGKLGFLAEVDVPDLPDALSAIDGHAYTTEPRLAVDAHIGGQVITAFNDIAFVRFPGHKTARRRGAGRGPAVRQLRGRRDRGRDADRLDGLQLLGRRADRQPGGGSPGGHAGRAALGLQPRAGRLVRRTAGAGTPARQRQARRRGRRHRRRRGRTRRPDRADPAARRRPGRPPRPHHVLPAGPAQAAADRLRGDLRHLRGRGMHEGDLPARPPRQRAALAPVADRGELGRVPAGPAAARRAVLDVGCGPGTITVDLAARVPEGQVTGIDAAAGVLAEARPKPSAAGQANVTFETGDVYRLAFDDATFDVVHAHQVLQHLSDPVAALTEMRRVCRPGGLVAAATATTAG